MHFKIKIMDVAVENKYTRRNKIHPKKFALLAACASIVMMFTAFTSAYIVRQAAGNWLEFTMPTMFTLSTITIILSSVALHASYIFFKKGNPSLYRGLLLVSFILGFSFIIMQYLGWQEMDQAMGISLGRNPAGDFVYVISGVHAAHVLGGAAVLLVAIIQAFALKYKVTEKRKLRFEMSLIYWHFVDFLWIYLFLFFTFQR